MGSATRRSLPSVNAVLEHPTLVVAIRAFGRDPVLAAVRGALEKSRDAIVRGSSPPEFPRLLEEVMARVLAACRSGLRPVINATGVIVHTNLGRTPLGPTVLRAVEAIAHGYSNLEFDLETRRRGSRHDHMKKLLTTLTGAEDALVMNNNAAAVFLILHALASPGEVIVSRGELIEIGGSFRLPEIMAASGARMVEVGTTNKTRFSDYERAVHDETRMLFKAHQSNFRMEGFVEEVTVRELSSLAHEQGIPLVFDQGSGWIRPFPGLDLEGEPSVVSSLQDGADLVAFSGDKLFGGPQAGVVVGRGREIEILSKHPLMRAMRPGKLTLAGLAAAAQLHLSPEFLLQDHPVYAKFKVPMSRLRSRAVSLRDRIRAHGFLASVVRNDARCGGGTLPGLVLPSLAVEVNGLQHRKSSRDFGERLYAALLTGDSPVVSILRQGRVRFDVLTPARGQLTRIAQCMGEIANSGWVE